MLKRYQVLLSSWQENYANMVSSKYGVSASETIRVFYCLGIIKAVESRYPKFKSSLTAKNITSISQSFDNSQDDEAQLHDLISTIYYEARKAAEYAKNQEELKKQPKSSKSRKK